VPYRAVSGLLTPPRLHWTQETVRSYPPVRVLPQKPGRSFTGTANLPAVTTSNTGISHDRSPRPGASLLSSRTGWDWSLDRYPPFNGSSFESPGRTNHGQSLDDAARWNAVDTVRSTEAFTVS